MLRAVTKTSTSITTIALIIVKINFFFGLYLTFIKKSNFYFIVVINFTQKTSHTNRNKKKTVYHSNNPIAPSQKHDYPRSH